MTTRPRVLVIEDEKAIRQLLEERLKKRYELSFASCQEEAYAHLRLPEIDLVLLDLKLPRTKSDMKPSTDVGIGILRDIRSRRLSKRGTEQQLPVVVMTAFGLEKLFSAEFVAEVGAYDYMPKPFGQDDTLEKKLELALCGEGAFNARPKNATKTVYLSFHPTAQAVQVESIEYQGAHFSLLAALRDIFCVDLQHYARPAEFRAVPGKELAGVLKVSDDAVRKRVNTFRKQVAQDFRGKLGRTLGDNDIVENERRWVGYRLNPLVVRIVRWEQTVGVQRRRT